jgi:hypothetical protein
LHVAETGGFRWDVAVMALQPVHATAENDACDPTSTTDGVIEVLLHVVNDTRLPTRVGVKEQEPASPFTSDGVCYTEDNGYGTERSVNSPVGLNEGFRHSIFVIAQHYYTPNHPDGD